jgi:hypothetical protein
VPDKSPLLIIPAAGIDFESLYFLVSDQRTPTDMTVIVDFSEDGYTQTSRKFFFTTLPAGFGKIRSALEPLAHGAPFRILRIGQGIIRSVVASDNHLKDYKPDEEQICFEIIPEDQRGMDENALVKVMPVIVDPKDTLLIPQGLPFFLRVEENASLEAVKVQIQGVLHKPHEVMTHYRFMIMQAPAPGIVFKPVFSASKVLKKDALIVIEPATQLLVMIIPGDEASLLRSQQEVRIRN